MSDLIERLRHADSHSQQRVFGSRIFGEAADRIEALERENAELRAALEPFAREGDRWNSIFGDSFTPNLTPSVIDEDDRELALFTIGDLRNARTALRDAKEREE